MNEILVQHNLPLYFFSSILFMCLLVCGIIYNPAQNKFWNTSQANITITEYSLDTEW